MAAQEKTTIWHFLGKYSKRLTIGGILLLFFTFFRWASPQALRYLFNEVVQNNDWSYFYPLLIIIVSIPILSAISEFLSNISVKLSGYLITSNIRKSVYRQIFRLSMTFHQENSSGVLVNRLMDDINLVQQLITGDTATIFVDLIVFAASFITILFISPLLAGILTVEIAIYVFFYRFFSKRIDRASRSYRRVQDRTSKRLEEVITGVRHVRIYNQQPNESELFQSKTERGLFYALTSRMNSTALSAVCNLIGGLGSAIIMITGSYFVLKGEMRLGDVIAVNTYIWMVLNPAIRLTSVAGQLTETFVSVRRVFALLNRVPTIRNLPDAKPFAPETGRIEFDDITFSYTPETSLYNRLSLDIPGGSSVALVGHTGCGKTSLSSLLLRHWELQNGEIRVDGQNIRRLVLEDYRSCFGAVLQDPVVFDGTIAENIAYGKPDATDEEIINAAKVAEIYSAIEQLPDNIHTEIGTYGVKLSVGEKQRISIARAIVKNPLILIMDEATSSLDSESEFLIQKALTTILKNRTSIVIAHRLSTIVSSDMIVMMDHGQILEKGTHNELMAIENGRYRDLYNEMLGKERWE